MCDLIEKIKKCIYTEERNDKHGHVIVQCGPLDYIKPTRQLKDYVLSHIVNMVDESVEISKKLGNTHSYVHIYMNGCLLRNFTLAFYSRMFKTLDSLYDDTLASAFIYDAPPAAHIAWKALSVFIESKTRKKITMVRGSQ